MLVLLLVLWLWSLGVFGLQHSPDGSVCFNNCSGHGDCVDYSCNCHAGFTGDDCRYSFARDDVPIVQIMGAGHYNLTKQNVTKAISSSRHILVGFSSYACHKCIAVEPEYANLTRLIDDYNKGVGGGKAALSFARFDVNLNKQVGLNHGLQDMPAVVLFQKGRPSVYLGPQISSGMFLFVTKLLGSPLRLVGTVDEAKAFLNASIDGIAVEYRAGNILPPIMVMGFFSAHGDVEEDEYEEFTQAAKQLQSREDIYFGQSLKRDVAKSFQQMKLIDRTPSVLLVNTDTGQHRALNLDDFFDKEQGLTEWITRNSIPLVGRMTGSNFQLYEKIGLPMLLMFLDLSNDARSSGGSSGKEAVLQGRSGGISNEDLLDELRAVAKEHHERLLFVYLDGSLPEHQDKMKGLGLYGGRERLPSLAFNTRDGATLPFPEELPVNRDALLRFCAAFLDGKLRSISDTKEMAKKALTATVPLSQKNHAVRQAVRKPPETVKGVAEHWGDKSPGDRAVVVVTADTIDSVLMQDAEFVDVVLLLHARNCEPCAHFAVYFKKMAERFAQLAIPSLLIARMDITKEAPPPEMGLLVGKLPLMVMLPAGNKHPPWVFFSGVGKMQSMMKWVQQNAAVRFELPNLPHLTEEEAQRFKEQVREREEHLEKQRDEGIEGAGEQETNVKRTRSRGDLRKEQERGEKELREKKKMVKQEL